MSLAADSRHAPQRPSIDDVLAAQAQATLVALPAALAAGATVKVSVWIAGVRGGGRWRGAVGGRARGGASRRARLVVRFGGARPISRVRLSRRLHDIARQARVPIASVDELPRGDGRLTALVTGAGRSRRIFISSELIRDWSDDEVAVVAAHELGHHAHHDLWRTLALDALLLSLAPVAG